MRTLVVRLSGLALALAGVALMLCLGLLTFSWTFGVLMSASGVGFLVLIILIAAFLVTGTVLKRWVLPMAQHMVDAGRNVS
jgi:hypothetical protein